MATGYSTTVRTKSSSQTNESWLNMKRKPDGTVMRPHELENKLIRPKLRDSSEEKEILDRIKGSLFGLALGDALGAHVEFRPRAFMNNNEVKTMHGGGTWGLEKGQFTDDTSMALCLAISLILKKDFVPYDQLVRYRWWYRYGYMSSTGNCFDIGKATRESLEEFERRQKDFALKHNIHTDVIDHLSDRHLLEDFDIDCSKDGVAGNGSLMRLAPVPLFFYRYPECAVEFSLISGRITHGDQLAYDACRYYAALIVAALKGETKKDLLSENFYSTHKNWFGSKALHPRIMDIIKGSYKRSDSKYVRGTGFVVESLEAALWAFFNDGDSFEKGVLKAINLGDDTDTTAAIYGQLAGAFYGFSKLTERWREIIYAKNFLHCISEWIFYEGQKWEPHPLQKLTVVNSNTIKQLFRNYDSKTANNTSSILQNNTTRPTIKTRTPLPLVQLRSFGSDTVGNNDKSRRQSLNEIPFHRSNSTKHTTTPTSSPQNQLYPTLPRTTVRPSSSPDPSSQERINSFLNDLKALENVGTWVESLGEDLKPYGHIFRAKNVDSFYLLNYVNENTLQNYGITNKDHRRHLLSHINGFKRIELNLDQILPPTN